MILTAKKQHEQKVMIAAMLWQQWVTANNNAGSDSNYRGDLTSHPSNK